MNQKENYLQLKSAYDKADSLLKKTAWTKDDVNTATEVFHHLGHYQAMKDTYKQLIVRVLYYRGSGANRLQKKALKFAKMCKINVPKICGLNDSYPNWKHKDGETAEIILSHPDCFVVGLEMHYGTLARRVLAWQDKSGDNVHAEHLKQLARLN